MKKKSDIRGFSLLEIMVVVAIVGIMAGSVVVGFNAFGNTIRTRETSGILTDLLKGFELETIRRDYQKLSIQFEPAYLVVEAQISGSTLPLVWNPNSVSCEGEGSFIIDNSAGSEPLFLAKNDAYLNRLTTYNYPIGNQTELCVPFLEASEDEWQYQLFTETEVSPIIRFVHFNRRRDLASPVLIDPNTFTLEISAPYAKKEFLDDGAPTTATVNLTLINEDESEIITLQN